MNKDEGFFYVDESTSSEDLRVIVRLLLEHLEMKVNVEYDHRDEKRPIRNLVLKEDSK